MPDSTVYGLCVVVETLYERFYFRLQAEDLDVHLMSFVNVLGVSVFLLIAAFHYVQAAAKSQ